MNWHYAFVHCLAKGNPHFRKPKFTNVSESRYSNDHDIGVVGLDNHTPAPIHCRTSDMHKYTCVHLLMRACGQAFHRVTLIADGILSFCHNDGTACAYFVDFVCKKVEPFSLVV